MFLLDSGGQYYDGTTDITRTISLDGKPTAEEKADYTRVLKGHIQLATAIFPEGTREMCIRDRIIGDEDAELLVVGWGSTYGHILSAVEEIRAAGRKIATVSYTHLLWRLRLGSSCRAVVIV